MTVSYTAYLEQLSAAFDHYLRRVGETNTRKNSTVLAHLASIASGESVTEAAVRMGVAQPSATEGRARAVSALRKAMGAQDDQDYPALRRALLVFMTPGTVQFLPKYTEKVRPA